MIRVIIADDQALIRDGLQTIELQEDMEVVGVAENGQQACELAAELKKRVGSISIRSTVQCQKIRDWIERFHRSTAKCFHATDRR